MKIIDLLDVDELTKLLGEEKHSLDNMYSTWIESDPRDSNGTIANVRRSFLKRQVNYKLQTELKSLGLKRNVSLFHKLNENVQDSLINNKISNIVNFDQSKLKNDKIMENEFKNKLKLKMKDRQNTIDVKNNLNENDQLNLNLQSIISKEIREVKKSKVNLPVLSDRFIAKDYHTDRFKSILKDNFNRKNVLYKNSKSNGNLPIVNGISSIKDKKQLNLCQSKSTISKYKKPIFPNIAKMFSDKL